MTHSDQTPFRHRRPRLAVRTFAIVLAASAPALAILAFSSVMTMRRVYEDATLNSLSQSATAFASVAVGMDVTTGPAATDFCERLAAGTSLRITIVDTDGTVLGDSASDYAAMDNHANRPEVAEALQGSSSTSMRSSPTLDQDMAYAAAPIRSDGQVVGVIRVAMGTPELRQRMEPFIVTTVLIAIMMMAAMAAASLRIGSSITEPIRALMDAAVDWSSGRLERRVRRSADPELAPLTDTMNAMAEELAERVVAMEHQQRELGAILNGMTEAVLSTDADLVIQLANPAARELLTRDGTAREVEGQTVLQASGNVSLDAMARHCATAGVRDEAELVLYGEKTRYLMVHAAPLAREDGRSGTVLVLNDITKLKRLERVRKDFVANVSHELRTPITLIKGFAETLEGVSDPDESQRFLAIVKRHADRMASIIDDLLTLARLESPERGILETTGVEAGSVLERSIESLGDRPADKGVSIRTSAAAGLVARANEGLLEQALLNLLDNAVKYGPAGATIVAEAVDDGDFVRFEVRDEGPGIPQRDLPRLFERFYRVDRARSRELGGTGLGLAIVRHIALAHGGDASVRSREGSGSTFCVRVPRWTDDARQSGPDSVQTDSPDDPPDDATTTDNS
ncbi:MAG: PAS domain-containing protein [Spirochaetales bacterium]|nr:PAS domain-containing protein [Spirochaetales bacterium]